jgi:uncharacterized protein
LRKKVHPKISLITRIVHPIARRVGGAFRGELEELGQRISPAARALIERGFSDLGGAPLVDHHAHIVGVGAGGTGAEVNPAWLTWRHPMKRFLAEVYLSATGAGSFDSLDGEYAARLARLARGFGRPIRIHLLAFDHFRNPDGEIVRERSEFHVPNEYVVGLAERHPGLFLPVMSVHPARRDALEELEKWAARGVRFMKWLPSAQGIDPADPRHDEFYRRMAARGLVLITHAGEEQAVESRSAQALGNPLRLRRALDHGVKVIMAHCAGMGRNEDIDHPGVAARNFDLFLRMMGEERYRGLLFGDISAVTQINRVPYPLIELLRRSELHDRLVNGSDYPLPAINFIISTRKLARLGLITADERRVLNEIYSCNPLLFDFLLKRALREPKTGNRFPVRVFVANAGLQHVPAVG